MSKPNSIVPAFLDKDSNPAVIKDGAVHDIFNARITSFESEKEGVIQPVLGNSVLNISTVSGTVGQTKCIGTFSNIVKDSVIYFVWDYLGNHKILQYNPSTSTIQTLLQGAALNFSLTSPIISADFYDKYLTWTDNYNPPRCIDIEKGNRTGKNVEATLYFGVPDDGTIIFELGQEYTFEAFDINGVSLFSELILTADGTYEDDVLTGAQAYSTAFNANATVSPYFTSEVCACGKVKITALANVLTTGTNTYLIAQMTATVGGIGSPAPTVLVYDNIYPNDFDEFHMAIPKWTPKCNPTAQYKNDPLFLSNFVNDKVFQFRYRYVYKENVKSCASPISPIAVPDLNCHGSGGNYIEIDFTDSQLSDPLYMNEFDKVELLVRQNNEGEWGMIVALDLCEFGITRQFYKFYNNEALIAVSQAEIIKPFESAPFVCKSLALGSEADAEGTRMFIGNGIEGYDNICGDFSVVKDSFTPDGCPYTYDVTGKIETWAVFVNNPDYKRQVVWWNGNNIVFGGFGAPVGGVPYTTNNLDTDYGQVLPAGGFTVYLAGTNYYGITKQRFNGGISGLDDLVYYDIDQGILDGSDDNKKMAIAALIQSGVVVTHEFTIKNVKHGQYIARVASHWCTIDGLYKGAPYKIDDTLSYQKTSTYVVCDITDSITPVHLAPLPSGFKELVFEVPYNTVSSGVVDIGATPFIIIDMTDGGIAQATAAADGYAYSRSIYSDSYLTDLSDGFALGYLKTISPSAPEVITSTDHNGFWMLAINSATTGYSRKIQIGFPAAVFSLGDFMYTADLSSFGGNALTTQNPLPGFGSSRCDHYVSLQLFPEVQILKAFSLSDGNGQPFKNVLITVSGSNVYGFTNEEGELNIYINTRDTFGTPIDTEYGCFALGTSCCLNFEEWDDNGVITPNTLPYDITGLVNPIEFYALPVAMNPFSTWKYGGSWSFRIAYFDAQNRVVGMTEVKENIKIDPLQSMNGVPTLSFSIPFLPPAIATHYQIIRTLNKYSYLQAVIGESVYYLNYSSSAVNSRTNFQAGNAQEIHINLQSITLFNNSSANTSINYEFKDGDSITILLYESGGVTVNPTYVDIPIRAQIGDYIVIDNDYDLPFLENGMLIQINMPSFANTKNELYYEFGECHPILESGGIRYHGKGHDSPYPDYVFVAQDQDPLNPSGVPATGLLIYGDTWRFSRTMQTYESNPAVKKGESVERQTIFWTYRVESSSLSDYFPSEDMHIGRPQLFDPLAERKRFTRMTRFSNVYKPETQTNGLFNYEPLSYRNLPIHIGDITKMVWTGDLLLVLGTVYPISLYVGRNTITDTNDNNLISISESVIPQYRTFQEQLGRTSGCKHPLSVVSIGDRVFWYDADNGTIMQYASNQLFPISDKKTKSYFRAWKTAGEFDLIAGYDKPYQEVLFTKTTNTKDTISYSLDREMWLSRYAFVPEFFAFTSLRLVSFKNGVLWEHDKGSVYLNFYASQSYFTIEMTFNDPYPIMKTWASMEIYARFVDESLGTFFLEAISGYTFDLKLQESTLADTDFKKDMGAYWAEFLRDLNSVPVIANPLITGQRLISNYLRVKLRTNNSKYFELWLINAYFDENKKTIK